LLVVDYLTAFYGNEAQVERKKKFISELRKQYPGMRHNPVYAKLELGVWRVSDYDRYYFEDYAAKCMQQDLGNWLKSKAGAMVGRTVSHVLKLPPKLFGFKPFPLVKRFDKDFGNLQPASSVASFILGRHEDDYFNLLPHKPKPKELVKHPERYTWDWVIAKGHAWLYGHVPPEDNPTEAEMKKVNEENAKRFKKNRGKVQRV
jgi:hypothetical protein